MPGLSTFDVALFYLQSEHFFGDDSMPSIAIGSTGFFGESLSSRRIETIASLGLDSLDFTDAKAVAGARCDHPYE